LSFIKSAVIISVYLCLGHISRRRCGRSPWYFAWW